MKQCPKCGAGNSKASDFCVRCGAQLSAAEPEKQSNVRPSNVQAAEASASLPASNPATLWLTLNIIATVLLCCSFSGVIANIIGIIYAAQASNAYQKGDAGGCLNNTGTSKRLFIAGAAMGGATILFLALFYLVYFFFVIEIISFGAIANIGG